MPDVRTIASFAGRTEHPKLPPNTMTRIGGFGGIEGLCAYLAAQNIAVVVDAVHPYAKRMHHHAAAACERLGLPLLGFARPAWSPQPGDLWHDTPDFTTAAEIASKLGRRIFLTIGRQELAPFATYEDRWFLIRSIDAPTQPLPPQRHLRLQRGPFSREQELALLREHRVDLIVSKNSGGSATFAKIEAARLLGIPIVMIRRPVLPAIPLAENIEHFSALFHACSTLYATKSLPRVSNLADA
jgi:precorrin-6A/cobalt-precorrin-6A reductase